MTQHEITFRQAVTITTAAVAAGQLSIQNIPEIEKAIVSMYSALTDAELKIIDDSIYAYAIATKEDKLAQPTADIR